MRAISSGFEDALSESVVRPRFFFSGEFSSGAQYYWTGNGSLSWNSHTWSGDGSLINFPGISETNNLNENSIEIILTGENSALVSLMLNELKHNQSGSLYFGLIDASGAIIADPFLIFSGQLDQIILDDSGKESTLRLTYGSELNSLTNSLGFRYNQETQHLFDSSDLGFEYMEQLADGYSGYWGKKRRRKKTTAGQ